MRTCVGTSQPKALIMAESRNDFMDLEAHWSRLEENIKKLRKSLQYWQTWEAEYEGLKEEILGLGNEATKQQLV